MPSPIALRHQAFSLCRACGKSFSTFNIYGKSIRSAITWETPLRLLVTGAGVGLRGNCANLRITAIVYLAMQGHRLAHRRPALSECAKQPLFSSQAEPAVEQFSVAFPVARWPKDQLAVLHHLVCSQRSPFGVKCPFFTARPWLSTVL